MFVLFVFFFFKAKAANGVPLSLWGPGVVIRDRGGAGGAIALIAWWSMVDCVGRRLGRRYFHFQRNRLSVTPLIIIPLATFIATPI